MKKSIKQDIAQENREYTKHRLARERQEDFDLLMKVYDKKELIKLAEDEIAEWKEFIKMLKK